MTNLCGHKRDVLIWALTDPDPLNNAEREKRVIVPIGGPIDITQCAVTPKQRAAACVLDPAKLAEMLAEALRERGVVVSTEEYDENADVDLWVAASHIFWGTPWDQTGYPPNEAHTTLLRIVSLPDGATPADAIKALEVT